MFVKGEGSTAGVIPTTGIWCRPLSSAQLPSPWIPVTSRMARGGLCMFPGGCSRQQHGHAPSSATAHFMHFMTQLALRLLTDQRRCRGSSPTCVRSRRCLPPSCSAAFCSICAAGEEEGPGRDGEEEPHPLPKPRFLKEGKLSHLPLHPVITPVIA